MVRTIVSTWYGAFLLEEGEVVRGRRAPEDGPAIADRIRARLAGRRTPEEEELLAARADEPWTTRDRRLSGDHVRFDPHAPIALPASEPEGDRVAHRAALLDVAETALADSWDPSIHVEEAVRATADLDRVQNLVGERLTSWASRDAPELDGAEPAAAARRLLAAGEDSPYAPSDPAVRAARRRLAELYAAIGGARAELSAAVEGAVPARTPNLSALLGPELAAKLLAQARGLDRLARLPASTIQVLGAERAFFEHLRGRAPPPRHGLLFLHPAIQSAPRGERGKLARTLAGKVAIAARLDRAGAPVDPSLARAVEARRARLKSERRPGSRRRRSGAPLDAAAGDG